MRSDRSDRCGLPLRACAHRGWVAGPVTSVTPGAGHGATPPAPRPELDPHINPAARHARMAGRNRGIRPACPPATRTPAGPRTSRNRTATTRAAARPGWAWTIPGPRTLPNRTSRPDPGPVGVHAPAPGSASRAPARASPAASGSRPRPAGRAHAKRSCCTRWSIDLDPPGASERGHALCGPSTGG